VHTCYQRPDSIKEVLALDTNIFLQYIYVKSASSLKEKIIVATGLKDPNGVRDDILLM
jgi:hypothetical protein